MMSMHLKSAFKFESMRDITSGDTITSGDLTNSLSFLLTDHHTRAGVKKYYTTTIDR